MSRLLQGTHETQKLTDVSRFRDESDSFIWSCAHTCERGDFFSLYYVYIYCDYIFLCLFSPPFPLILLAVPLWFYRTSVGQAIRKKRNRSKELGDRGREFKDHLLSLLSSKQPSSNP